MALHKDIFIVTLVYFLATVHNGASMCNTTGQFKISPATQLLNLGDTNVQIRCAAEPGEVCLWRWNFYNTTTGGAIEITDNTTNYGVYILRDGTLYIPTILPFHATTYRCFQLSTSRTSPLASINLRTKLQYVNGQTSFCVDPGSTGKFPFSAIGYPVPTVTLYKMGSLGQWSLVNDNRFVVSVSSVTVMGAKGTDDGMYLINGTNGFSSNQLAFRLNVSDFDAPLPSVISPIWVSQLYQLTTITCSVQTSAIQGVGCGQGSVSTGLTMQWTTGGSMVPQDPSQAVYVVNSVSSSTLTFASLQRDQRGTYTCQATNLKGTNTTSIMVYVYPDPVSGVSSSVSSSNVVTISWTPVVTSGIVSYRVYYSKAESSETPLFVDTTTSSAVLSGLQKGNYKAYVVTMEQILSSPTPLMSSSSTFARFAVGDSSLSSEPMAAVAVTSTVPFIVGVACGSVFLGLLVLIIIVFTIFRYNSYKQRLHQQRTWVRDEEMDGKEHCNETNKYIPPITLPVSVANGDMGLYPEQPDSVSHCGEEVDPKWEFPPDLLQLSEVLYDGFSTVLYKGTANGIKSDKAIDVAVKCCKDQASEEDVRALIADMEQLAGLGSHPNIVGLLRVCTVESPVCMVVEYMCHGDLLGFLRASRGHHGMYTVFPGKRELLPSLNLTSRDLINIATKIASGMTFLEERKVVHGSLCARNVLVGTSLDIKINLRTYDLNRDSVLKWMSPETLFDGTSTTYSDVWSFGVTMWELVTLGGTPYAEILPVDLYPQLYGGMRMARPPHCAPEVYEIMRACWDHNPVGRPTFADMCERLDSLCTSKMSVLDLRNYDGNEYSQFDELATVL